MEQLIIQLAAEYRRLLELRSQYDAWYSRFKESEYSNIWTYQNQTQDKAPQEITAARIKRTGLLLRQSLLDFEKHID